MKTRILMFLSLFAILHLLVFSGQPWLSAATSGALLSGWLTIPSASEDWSQQFRVTSTTYENEQTVPASMVFNGVLGSSCIGGNMSPELKWTKARPWTQSYAVVAYDVTANFTHWGIYNIPPDVTELPENAGVATSN